MTRGGAQLIVRLLSISASREKLTRYLEAFHLQLSKSLGLRSIRSRLLELLKKEAEGTVSWSVKKIRVIAERELTPPFTQLTSADSAKLLASTTYNSKYRSGRKEKVSLMTCDDFNLA